MKEIEALPGRLRTADLLGALSLASDLAVGLPAEHAVRSCYIGMHIADNSACRRISGPTSTTPTC